MYYPEYRNPGICSWFTQKVTDIAENLSVLLWVRISSREPCWGNSRCPVQIDWSKKEQTKDMVRELPWAHQSLGLNSGLCFLCPIILAKMLCCYTLHCLLTF